MDQCVTVERELEKVLHKFSGYGQLCERGLEELIDYTGGLKHEILQSHGFLCVALAVLELVDQAGLELTTARLTGQDAELSGTLSLVLTQCCKRIKDTVQKLASDHKDIHSSVSRVGKAIDKNFDSDISSVGIDGCWQADSQRLLNEVMVEHFFRQGMLDVAEELCQESGLSVDPSQKEPFVELNRILEALKVRVLRPALEWAVSNREMLIAQNSSLEFKLHRLYFISLLMGGTTNQREALQYAKNFQPFALNHQKDIQWADIFFSAGCVALPALINIKAVIEQRQCTGVWNQKDELPIEVDLGKKCWYHSIFACPILRQQTTDNNPPMKLVCGHIISRDALNKMFNGSKIKMSVLPNGTESRRCQTDIFLKNEFVCNL
ncbi:E3 ubiquitin-protein ligase RMND5A [Apodemus speciosus]|uniref:E3 ubiquitin-protein ligase RMND5A n=1 Tax=Apodemus speciosus TaxID=105296 RepID=A0ABQ0EV47_APOSI